MLKSDWSRTPADDSFMDGVRVWNLGINGGLGSKDLPCIGGLPVEAWACVPELVNGWMWSVKRYGVLELHKLLSNYRSFIILPFNRLPFQMKWQWWKVRENIKSKLIMQNWKIEVRCNWIEKSCPYVLQQPKLIAA